MITFLLGQWMESLSLADRQKVLSKPLAGHMVSHTSTLSDGNSE